MRAGVAAKAAATLLIVGLALAAGTASAQQKDKDRKAGAAPAAPAAAGAGSPAAKPSAANYAERFASLCAACHGANGRSDVAGTPVLAGQHSLYAITQLFMFREGRRANEAMTAVAKTMTDADMRGFADYIGTLPPVAPAPPPTPPDAARMSKGHALAQQHKCAFCHGADLSGGQGVPRIGGQHEDYLLATLKGFHAHTRAGYTRAMSEAMSQVPAQDLDVLAYYAARVPVAGGK